jgi:hypothetical protein
VNAETDDINDDSTDVNGSLKRAAGGPGSAPALFSKLEKVIEGMSQ